MASFDASPPNPFTPQGFGTIDRALERALVLRVRSGDTHAFTILVEQYMERVTRFATYTLGSRDAAEDVTQNVFVKMWEQRATLDPDSPLKPYLYRAVRNRALNERKAESVRARYRDLVRAESSAESMCTAIPSHEEVILSEATVQAALRSLSDRRRLAVRLRLKEGLKYPDVAIILGISTAAAERLVRRALAELREILRVSG